MNDWLTVPNVLQILFLILLILLFRWAARERARLRHQWMRSRQTIDQIRVLLIDACATGSMLASV